MPKKSTFNEWVLDLAVDNLMLFRPKVEKNGLVIQSDGGPNDQEVVIATVFDPDETTDDLPSALEHSRHVGRQATMKLEQS